jgi:cell wall-associated NlpC family hydrolase
MSTIGWFLILSAILVIRQVARGRVLNTAEDLSDAFLAIVNGDSQALAGVATRTGDYNAPSEADVAEGLAPAKAISGQGMLSAAVSLGGAAKGYRWAATGPSYYDCSGLVYRAAQKVGYTGRRFTTADVSTIKGFYPVTEPAVGDIVVWSAGQGGVTGHMGIVSGDDQFYSARSVRSGIGYSKISTFRKAKPHYLRFMSTSESAKKSSLTKQNVVV